MSFGSRNIGNKTEFELIRFCNILDTNVIGASSNAANVPFFLLPVSCCQILLTLSDTAFTFFFDNIF